jgi:pantoate--beta-alanine ligase
MLVIRTINDMADWVNQCDRTIALVPTQGCLHHGHESLLKKAKNDAGDTRSVVMSLFVNPLQFRKNAYEVYPRQTEHDLVLAQRAGVDVVFAPEAADMYREVPNMSWIFEIQERDEASRDDVDFVVDRPDDAPEFEYVRVPRRLTHRMDGVDHPWHFDGVATVVRKLFQIIQPDYSYFGLKDIQQLAILRSMNQWMGSPTQIIPVPVVRDDDGLSSSSRLVMLNKEQRWIASQAVHHLKQAFQQMRTHEDAVQDVICSFRDSLRSIDTGAHTLEIDAVTYTDSTTLDELSQYSEEGVLYFAYIINGIRLAETLSTHDI